MQVMLYAGPVGLQVSKILELIHSLGLAPAKWGGPERKGSRVSQIRNVVCSTGLFVHVGSHRYTIAAYPDVEAVPLNRSSLSGKQWHLHQPEMHVLMWLVAFGMSVFSS